MCAIISIESIDLVGRGHGEDMSDRWLTWELDPRNLRPLSPFPILGMYICPLFPQWELRDHLDST